MTSTRSSSPALAVSSSGGIVGSTLQIMFIVLKIIGVITWSWWWVMSPMWISASLALVIIIIIIGFVIIARRQKRQQARRGSWKSR